MEDVLFRSGDAFLPKPVRSFLEIYLAGNDRSLLYVNIWSLVHLLSGVLTGWILTTRYPDYDYYWTGFWVHTLWETWQVLVRNTPYWRWRGRLDVVTDTLFFMGGMLFFSRLFTGKANV